MAQAQRTIAREGNIPSVGIDINALMDRMRSTIGALTVERDALSVQLAQRDSVIEQLGAQIARLTPSTPEEEPDPPEIGEGPGEPTEEELTGKAAEAVAAVETSTRERIIERTV